MNARLKLMAKQVGSTGVDQVWFTRKEALLLATTVLEDCMKVLDNEGEETASAMIHDRYWGKSDVV